MNGAIAPVPEAPIDPHDTLGASLAPYAGRAVAKSRALVLVGEQPAGIELCVVKAIHDQLGKTEGIKGKAASASEFFQRLAAKDKIQVHVATQIQKVKKLAH